MDSTALGRRGTQTYLAEAGRNIPELETGTRAAEELGTVSLSPWVAQLGNSNGSLFGLGLDKGMSLHQLPSLLFGSSTLLGHTQTGGAVQKLGSDTGTDWCLAIEGTSRDHPAPGLTRVAALPRTENSNNANFGTGSSLRPDMQGAGTAGSTWKRSAGWMRWRGAGLKRQEVTAAHRSPAAARAATTASELASDGTKHLPKTDGAPSVNIGVWSEHEMEMFYKALLQVGRDFQAMARIIRTRSASQVTGVFHRCLRRAIDPVKRAAMIRPEIAEIAESMHLFDRVLQPDLQIRTLLAARQLETRGIQNKDGVRCIADQTATAFGKCASTSDACSWAAALLSLLRQEPTAETAASARPESSAAWLNRAGAGAYAALSERDSHHTEPGHMVDIEPDRILRKALTTTRDGKNLNMEVSLQIVPLPRSPEEIKLEQWNRNPRILLTLRLKKRFAAVFDHLAEKWASCIASSVQTSNEMREQLPPAHLLRLRVCTDEAYRTGTAEFDELWNANACRMARANGLGHWMRRSDEGEQLLVSEIHRLCGSPSHIRLQYEWISACGDSESALAPESSEPRTAVANACDAACVAYSKPPAVGTSCTPPRFPQDAVETGAKLEMSSRENNQQWGRNDVHREGRDGVGSTSIQTAGQRTLDDAQASTDSLLRSLLYGVQASESNFTNDGYTSGNASNMVYLPQKP
jgi:hypothetical protein